MLPPKIFTPLNIKDTLYLIANNLDKAKDVRNLRNTCGELLADQELTEIESQLNFTELKATQFSALEKLGLKADDGTRTYLIRFATGMARLFKGKSDREITRLESVVMVQMAPTHYYVPGLDDVYKEGRILCKANDIPTPSETSFEVYSDEKMSNVQKEIIGQQIVIVGSPVSLEDAVQKIPELTLRTITHPNLNPDLTHWEKSSMDDRERALSIAWFTTRPGLMRSHYEEIHHIKMKTIADYRQKMSPPKTGCIIL